MSTNEVAPDVAERNRTLRVSDDEARSLAADILTAEDLRSGRSWMDATIRGDMTEALSCLPDEAFDLIILDPPYNLNKDFGTTRFRAASTESYQAYIESWLPTVCAKLKPTGSLYLCGEWRSSAVLQTALMRHLTVINRITWQREKGRSAGRNWKNAMEDIWFAVKDEHLYYFNADAVKQCRRVRAPYRQDGLPKDWHETERGRIRLTGAGNFWDDLSVPFWSMPENTDHPTQKPEKLIAKLILASSKPDDIVLDPFLGSGTSSVVARKLGRHFCGIEREASYCLVAAKRLRAALTDKHIQGYEDGIFWERNSTAEMQKHNRVLRDDHQ